MIDEVNLPQKVGYDHAKLFGELVAFSYSTLLKDGPQRSHNGEVIGRKSEIRITNVG